MSTSIGTWCMGGLLGLLITVGTGCSGACGEAEDLCKECEGGDDVTNAACEAEFGGASVEYCEQAITTYEANCPGRE